MAETAGGDVARDHVGVTDGFAARRYFAKFARITGHLGRVAAEMARDGSLSRLELEIVGDYVGRLSGTFRALGTKYLLTGRETGSFLGSLAIDVTESGFPVQRELMVMANDRAQAERHLAGLPDRAALIERMLEEILGRLAIPTRGQYAMSQRLYYEALLDEPLFWPTMDPLAVWLSGLGEERRYLLHWAVYDSQVNLPVIYLMELRDSGRAALATDHRRWPEVQRHLVAQALAGLKLVTIATGFDQDFDDLHPVRLRRIHVGPMYSSAFTRQAGPIRQVLEAARAPAGEDWALAWTLEDLEAERSVTERKGWFGSVERQVFALDPFAGRGADTGATRTERAVILPERPFQALAEADPPGFRNVRKFVVGPSGRVLSYR
jgi:hypothetical protein